MDTDDLQYIKLDARVALLEQIVTQGLRAYHRTLPEPRKGLEEWAGHMRAISSPMTFPNETPERSMLLAGEYQEHLERFLKLLLQGFR